jgi:hypothetical protein
MVYISRQNARMKQFFRSFRLRTPYLNYIYICKRLRMFVVETVKYELNRLYLCKFIVTFAMPQSPPPLRGAKQHKKRQRFALWRSSVQTTLLLRATAPSLGAQSSEESLHTSTVSLETRSSTGLYGATGRSHRACLHDFHRIQGDAPPEILLRRLECL